MTDNIRFKINSYMQLLKYIDSNELRNDIVLDLVELIKLIPDNIILNIPTHDKNKAYDEGDETSDARVIQAYLDDLNSDRVCAVMIWCEAFGQELCYFDNAKAIYINNIIENKIEGWEKVASVRFSKYGVRRGWKRITSKSYLNWKR